MGITKNTSKRMTEGASSTDFFASAKALFLFLFIVFSCFNQRGRDCPSRPVVRLYFSATFSAPTLFVTSDLYWTMASSGLVPDTTDSTIV